MFRRRRMFQANPLAADQVAILVKANQLLTQGKPLDAGPLFASVAQAMQVSHHPRRAANLFTRAAHAYTDGKDAEHALTYARQALNLFAQTRMARRASTFYANVTRKMTNLGMNATANELEQEFGAQIAALPMEPQSATPARHGLLPTDCPKCGAPVHSEDITWVDEVTAECEYCGMLIRSS
jgi:hypothetical protein